MVSSVGDAVVPFPGGVIAAPDRVLAFGVASGGVVEFNGIGQCGVVFIVLGVIVVVVR